MGCFFIIFFNKTRFPKNEISSAKFSLCNVIVTCNFLLDLYWWTTDQICFLLKYKLITKLAFFHLFYLTMVEVEFWVIITWLGIFKDPSNLRKSSNRLTFFVSGEVLFFFIFRGNGTLTSISGKSSLLHLYCSLQSLQCIFTQMYQRLGF